MRDVLEVQERLGRLFETAFRVEDIAESLASFDSERPAAHPAGLDFGDCFSYALAKLRGERLLHKCNDFVKTDIERAS